MKHSCVGLDEVEKIKPNGLNALGIYYHYKNQCK